ncbi:hypothetical protein ALC57_02330 [Trachymyrmex cornetzi]|uniref:Uncharacterized protein n=1 Tax=Trachymyrmex cornetzi TaxID=471704 RepID=A0A195EK79_9HYME|nr:hypothetical protein ALC57_02330 [Trachymyrmex cornetzi]
MVAVAEEENGCDKKESSEDAETTLWKLSRDESCGERKKSKSGDGKGQKAGDLLGSVVRRNARHPQFTGNQRRECFVAVQGDELDAPFIPRCHRRIISPRARTGSPVHVPPLHSEEAPSWCIATWRA